MIPPESYSLDLWLFAARYSFLELESRCRSSTPTFDEIKSIFCDPTKGLAFLHRVHNIPFSILDVVIQKALEDAANAIKSNTRPRIRF